jgi:hypothetical protein
VNDVGLFPVATVDPEVVMGEGNGTSQRQPSDDDGKDIAFHEVLPLECLRIAACHGRHCMKRPLVDG